MERITGVKYVVGFVLAALWIFGTHWFIMSHFSIEVPQAISTEAPARVHPVPPVRPSTVAVDAGTNELSWECPNFLMMHRDSQLEAAYQAGFGRASDYYEEQGLERGLRECTESLMDCRHPDAGVGHD
jgi:hypothetical protein